MSLIDLMIDAMSPNALSDAALDALIAEDVPYGDLTTLELGFGARPGRMIFAARQPMVVAGVELAARMLIRAGAQVIAHAESGDAVGGGERLLVAEGRADALHRVWKVSQTLVEHLSGIASRARRIVAAARAERPGVVVACTRKSVAGTRAVMLHAIRAGGAVPHRTGLSDSLLVMAEHRAFLDGSMLEHLLRLRRQCPERKLVVEVSDPADAFAWAGAVDVLQLEHIDPDGVAAIAARLGHPRPLLAAAGGVTEANAGDFVRAGADLLVTSAPYTAPPADVKVTLTPL